jgi:CBS domain-containing protein
MTVGIILARKGRDVVTIDLGATLGDAARLLAERHIGAALILGADQRIARVGGGRRSRARSSGESNDDAEG